MEETSMKWKQDLIDDVWQHARVATDADPAVFRQDACGAWIHRDQFEHQDGEFRWRIENVSGGGPDVLANLRAFHVRNHFEMSSKHPHCAVTADRADVPAGEYVRPPRNRSA
jgi:hypothetical protein